MAHHSTVLGQLLRMVSRHEFEQDARRHHEGRKLRSMSRWSQFVAMAMAQLSGRCSLRDVVANLEAQKRKLYHLGVGRVARSSLARVNQEQPHELFELQFKRLLDRCRSVAPGTAGFLRLYDDKFLATPVCLPSRAEQARIRDWVGNLTARAGRLIERERQQLGRAEELRSRLIADVVTGKIDVREAAASLPEVDPLEMETA